MSSKKLPAGIAGIALLLHLSACFAPQARSARSFYEIQQLVRNQSAERVLELLGEPDSRQTVFDADERWIWWNYTFLEGRDCPPELRGRVVHLEIVFENPEHSPVERPSYSEWRVDDALGVSFQMPATDD